MACAGVIKNKVFGGGIAGGYNNYLNRAQGYPFYYKEGLRSDQSNY